LRTRRSDSFTTITVAGQVLPADLLQRIADKDKELGGLGADSYHLSPSETISEATSRAWNKLVAAWGNFTLARSRLPANDPGTTVTRERWLLPLFQELGYGRLPASRSAVEIDGKGYAISHWWSSVPIHLVGAGVSIDKLSARIPGAARSSPHSLVQELLNRSEESLWGFVSNGLQLRILRDNQNLVRQAYVEFDLETMMEGDAYSDFVMLWLLCHQSRVEAEEPHAYWLEKWSQAAQERGVRALEHLREGVEEAISRLGTGFLAHRINGNLKEKLRSGLLNKQDYYRQLLRLVYRLLFLFVSEDRLDEKHRSLLFNPDATTEACERYRKFYSTKKLRGLAERRHGSRHSDLYAGLRLVMQKLGSDDGCSELGLPALGSFLFSETAIADLADCEIANHDFLDAVRALAFATDNQARRQIDYKNLGSEELGSVYESLLELHPQLNVDAATFTLSTAAGHERKTTGSYYTHDSLVQCLLDSALDPVIRKREHDFIQLGYDSAASAILDLKVCDPACGSGHFLIAAAHRLAKRLASARTGDDEPSPEAVRHALRDVVGRCLYGVDVNPMAVELCKVSLWMEALEPGKPLSFLEHHIQFGNSLIGSTPASLREGIPDDAFKPIEGDDPALCKEYKRQNKHERETRQQEMFDPAGEPWRQLGNLPTALIALEGIPDDKIAGIHEREERWHQLVRSNTYRYASLLADAWCAAFVWKKSKSSSLPYPITEEVFRKIEANPFNVANGWMEIEIVRLAEQYQFFHWHLAFAEVFRASTNSEEAKYNAAAGWSGGFDVVLGNPPWEKVNLKEQEWFSERRPDIADAPNAADRKRIIEQLKTEDPVLHRQFLGAVRQAGGESHFLRSSGLYPLCGRGDINLYAVFAESMRSHVSPSGRVGCIVQSDIATSDTCKFFFDDLIVRRNLVSFFDFVNTEGLFPAIHRTHPHFCLLTLDAQPQKLPAVFSFWNTNVGHLNDLDRRFSLSAEDISLLNPNTRTCPIFHLKRDAELTKSIYRRVPVLFRHIPESNPWQIEIGRMFHTSDDSKLFLPPDDQEDVLPLYESKCFWQYDHRYANFTDEYIDVSQRQKQNEFFGIRTRYVVARNTIPRKFLRRLAKWFLAYRRITNTTNERTVIASIIPECGLLDSGNLIYVSNAKAAACLMTTLNSYPLDFLCRESMGGTNLHLYVIEQLPILPPTIYAQPCAWAVTLTTLQDWLVPRVLELTYTAWDLESFAQDCGHHGPPFRWDEERRFLLRCELEAALFHLYLGHQEEWHNEPESLLTCFANPRSAVQHIIDSFPIVKRKDEEKFGEYLTKRLVLEIYEEMAQAIATGQPYQTRLDPPPADPRVAHPPRVQLAPLVLPPAIRHPQPDAGFYMMRVILSMIQENNGSIDVERLMNACELLAMPDRLEAYGSTIEPSLAHQWRSSFTDQFRPNLFLSKVDDLIQRGEIRLTRDGTQFKVTRIGTAVLPTDEHIEFDARFALRVNDSLPQAEKDAFTPLATRDQIEERTRAA